MACYTKKEARELWDYAKAAHLRVPGPKGYLDFKELTNRLSDDIFKATGGKRRIVPEEIARLLNTPKSIKYATKNLLMTDRNRAYMLSQARNFVTGQEQTPLARFAQSVYQAPYAGKTLD